MGEKSFTAARRIRWAVGFALLLLALALFFVWSLMSGSVALRAGEVLSAVLSGGGNDLVGLLGFPGVQQYHAHRFDPAGSILLL